MKSAVAKALIIGSTIFYGSSVNSADLIIKQLEFRSGISLPIVIDAPGRNRQFLVEFLIGERLLPFDEYGCQLSGYSFVSDLEYGGALHGSVENTDFRLLVHPEDRFWYVLISGGRTKDKIFFQCYEK